MGPRGGGHVPAFDGRGANIPDYDHQAHLRMWAYSRFECRLLELARAELSARVATSAPHVAGPVTSLSCGGLRFFGPWRRRRRPAQLSRAGGGRDSSAGDATRRQTEFAST